MMKSVSITFRSERGDEFPVNFEYDFDSHGKLYGVALPTGTVSAYGQYLKLTYTVELPSGEKRSVRFEPNRPNHVYEVLPSDPSAEKSVSDNT
jgi:hypothetical protein